MKEKLTIVKVGGAVVEDGQQLRQLLDDFARIDGAKVLVHGGGRRATKVAAALGIESKMVGGRRITDAEMLEVVTMVYGGLVNKNVVAQLQARHIDAIGLTGADLDVIRSHRRPLKHMVVDDVEQDVDFGFVGDVDYARGSKLHHLIGSGAVPVMAPLTHDGKGNLLNTNADTIVAETAKAMAEIYDVTLVYAFEKAGVLRDADDDSSVIPLIDKKLFEQYKNDGTISGGMLPKIENALQAVEAGVARVVITSAQAIASDGGTTIKL